LRARHKPQLSNSSPPTPPRRPCRRWGYPSPNSATSVSPRPASRAIKALPSKPSGTLGRGARPSAPSQRPRRHRPPRGRRPRGWSESRRARPTPIHLIPPGCSQSHPTSFRLISARICSLASADGSFPSKVIAESELLHQTKCLTAFIHY